MTTQTISVSTDISMYWDNMPPEVQEKILSTGRAKFPLHVFRRNAAEDKYVEFSVLTDPKLASKRVDGRVGSHEKDALAFVAKQLQTTFDLKDTSVEALEGLCATLNIKPEEALKRIQEIADKADEHRRAQQRAKFARPLDKDSQDDYTSSIVDESTGGTMDPVQRKVGFDYVDVLLHGRYVRLDVIKRFLKKHGLSQKDMGDEAGGLHQTTVSAFLRGKEAMNPEFIDYLNEVVTEPELSEFLDEEAGLTREFPKAKHPKFAKDLSVIPMTASASGKDPAIDKALETTPEPAQMETVTAEAVMPVFDLAKAQKLIEGVRKAKKEGTITSTFSLRKGIMWAEAFYLLLAEGYTRGQATALAFHLAVEGKTYGEDRTFHRELFESIFGTDIEPFIRPAGDGDTRHPMDKLVEPLVRECKPVWLFGPTGAGKTHSSLDIPKRLGRPYLRVQGSDDSTLDDLIGGWAVRSGSTVFEYGPMPVMMKVGGTLVIDEISQYPQEVTVELQAVLEGNPLVLKRNRGEVIFPSPGFSIIVTDNSLGLGEAMEYVGTRVMNEAFRDRFYFAHYDYMSEELEGAIISSHLDRFLAERNWEAA